MPPRPTAAGVVRYIVLLPIRLGDKRLPRGLVERRSLNAPAAIRQIFEIQFAVVRIHWRLERTDGVKALHELIPARSRNRAIREANTSSICSFQKFTLMADLCLPGTG